MWEKQIKTIEKIYKSIPGEDKKAAQPSREQFARLLTEPFAARKIPGIPCRMNENENYKCSADEAAETKAFMKKMYNIDSKESLLNYQKKQFECSVHYEQFMTFWKEAPLFDVDKLQPEGRKIFEMFMAQAKEFYPLLQERGFYAWDICEYIGVCRTANSCGIISDKEFDEITDRYVRKAQVFYHSFKEYALSYLCGAIYFMTIKKFDGQDQFLDLQGRIIANLCEKGAPWQKYAWYRPEKREWVQIYPGDPGCIVSKAAFEKGIGYMYRDEPTKDRPDSGWRFFHGDESDEYANNPDNLQIIGINAICNLRPDILAYLEAPNGSAYGWNGQDWIKEKLYGEGDNR